MENSALRFSMSGLLYRNEFGEYVLISTYKIGDKEYTYSDLLNSSGEDCKRLLKILNSQFIQGN